MACIVAAGVAGASHLRNRVPPTYEGISLSTNRRGRNHCVQYRNGRPKTCFYLSAIGNNQITNGPSRPRGRHRVRRRRRGRQLPAQPIGTLNFRIDVHVGDNRNSQKDAGRGTNSTSAIPMPTTVTKYLIFLNCPGHLIYVSFEGMSLGSLFELQKEDK